MNILGVKDALVMFMLNDSKFIKRVLSSIVLAPIVIACVYFGGVYFQILIGMLLGIAMFEWWRISFKIKYSPIIGVFGAVYIGICIGAFYQLRMDFDGVGIYLTICLLALVWSGDTGAYFAGKFIGGVKMAPKLSPNKTWSGLIGGMIVGGGVFYLLVGYFLDITHIMVFVFGALMGVVGQIGDVVMSAMKRYVGIKDTGNLIPGHGGILDRIDALLPVSLCVYVAYILLFGVSVA